MNIQMASDEFLAYLQVEKNCSPKTLRSYAFDLHVFKTFIEDLYTSSGLQDLNPSMSRRFIQDQVINHQTKPRTKICLAPQSYAPLYMVQVFLLQI
jgi:site-specific recombinase XerD